MTRVAPPAWVSGCGVVSPLGNDIDAFDAALFAGCSAVRAEAIELPGNGRFEVPLARSAFDAARVAAPSKLPLDRGSAMALAAAEAAVAMAGLAPGGFDPERAGLYWGSGMGGAATFEANCQAIWAEQRRLRPSAVVTSMPNAPLAEVALRLGTRGTAIGYACACASAAVAIGEALRALQAGALDLAIVGGSEALLTPAVVGAWHAMRVLGPARSDACRPFAADRAGFALGEGAAAFVIETEAHARARGAATPWRLAGYATSCDATHVTQPDADGQVRAMRAALRSAGLQPQDIGHVNAHGTGTLAGDQAEANSLQRVFGATPPAVTASKAISGHLLGAGGAVELLALLRALQQRSAPPTAHVADDDPALGIDLVRGSARALPALRHAMSNSFAFGGTNAVLIASLAP
ncbi:beta-ketoacyl-[acyl-carrier-protein] synthase family protein [Piscinibacter sp.]|uniref:beta-ketoacyl-[acyl-carrier-protein] synthase family protein n=1 Tax=Piscinibacter sp. TaxID=1903157 RepID=UPI0039E6D850